MQWSIKIAWEKETSSYMWFFDILYIIQKIIFKLFLIVKLFSIIFFYVDTFAYFYIFDKSRRLEFLYTYAFDDFVSSSKIHIQ